MQAEKRQLPAGLYLVPTPIGNARDITLRALDVLRDADALAAEDTRNLRHLMDIHGVALDGRRVIAWHDHSSDRDRDRLVAMIRDGASLAYASDAGMPMISDPGYVLMRDVVAAGLYATVLPGASAVLTALVLSGLPAERFQFVGFPPVKAKDRMALWESLKSAALTTILFESARRSSGTIRELMAVLGEDRPAALCRELTKKFETALRGTLADVAAQVDAEGVKGEVVILVGRSEGDAVVDVEGALKAAMAIMSVKDATDAVSKATGLPKRQVYQTALGLKDGSA
ncbi:MAG: 16S rRNA (cytidine(1402)-2'-O)-methyltransferase [Deltaproteobacteria bacterium]